MTDNITTNAAARVSRTHTENASRTVTTMASTKRIFTALVLLLASATSFGASQFPLSLLSTTGSTAGQVPVSTGPTTPVVWGTAGVGLFAPLVSPTFTGNVGVPSRAAGDSTSNAASTAFVYGTLAAPQIGIGSTTPNAGAFTTLSATGLISPSSAVGIKGTTTNDNAQAGSIGEYVTATGGPASQGSGVTQSVGVVTLSAGDWDVEATGVFLGSAANMSIAYIGVSTTLNALGALGTYTNTVVPTVVNTMTFASPVVRLSLTTSTLVYAAGNVNITTGTTTFQTVIRARRVR
jgi:hypothetical protein